MEQHLSREDSATSCSYPGAVDQLVILVNVVSVETVGCSFNKKMAEHW